MPVSNEDRLETTTKKLPPNSVLLQTAGELLLARSPSRETTGLFKRYQILLESLANMERQERLLNYKFLLGLIFTSHAKKTKDAETRKMLFDHKNELYLNLSNHKESRRKLAFKYLVSKNFRVTKFCAKCETDNDKQNKPKHQWKFCKSCEVDRKFFNVLSIHHKFPSGSMTLFLSNDLVEKVENLRMPHKGKLSEFSEEARLDKYHYNVRNLDVFDLESVIKAKDLFINKY